MYQYPDTAEIPAELKNVMPYESVMQALNRFIPNYPAREFISYQCEGISFEVCWFWFIPPGGKYHSKASYDAICVKNIIVQKDGVVDVKLLKDFLNRMYILNNVEYICFLNPNLYVKPYLIINGFDETKVNGVNLVIKKMNNLLRAKILFLKWLKSYKE